MADAAISRRRARAIDRGRVRHVLVRAEARAGVEGACPATLRRWEKSIRAGACRLVLREPGAVRIYEVDHEGTTLRIVYDRARHIALTVLAPEMLGGGEWREIWGWNGGRSR